MDADPELDPPVLRHIGVLRRHGALDFDRATRPIDRAGELDQQAIAGGLDDASMMFGDFGIDDVFP